MAKVHFEKLLCISIALDAPFLAMGEGSLRIVTVFAKKVEEHKGRTFLHVIVEDARTAGGHHCDRHMNRQAMHLALFDRFVPQGLVFVLRWVVNITYKRSG